MPRLPSPFTGQKFDRLVGIIARLREPDGCPWDRKQTAQSFKSYVIEEAHELLEAIDSDNHEDIREELGDLLFQLIFLARLYEEKSLFSMTEVIETISQKMVRRHPHVFGELEAGSEEDLHRRWQEIKIQEKQAEGRRTNPLASVPRTLPALRRAQRISERASKAGSGAQDLAAGLKDAEIKLAGLAAAIRNDRGYPAVGEILFALVEVCRLAEINAEEALQKSLERLIEGHSPAASSPAQPPAGSGKNN